MRYLVFVILKEVDIFNYENVHPETCKMKIVAYRHLIFPDKILA